MHRRVDENVAYAQGQQNSTGSRVQRAREGSPEGKKASARKRKRIPCAFSPRVRVAQRARRHRRASANVAHAQG